MTDDPKKPAASLTPSQAPSETSSGISPGISSEDEQPEIYGVTKGKDGIVLKRRSFLGALAATGALASAGTLTGCIPLPGFGNSDPASSPGSAANAKAHNGEIQGLFLRDTSLFSWDATTLKAWDITKGTLRNSASKSSLEKDLKQAGTTFSDLFLHVWDNRPITFGSDGDTLAVNGWEGVEIWKSAGGKPRKVKTLKGSPAQTRAVCFHPDGKTVAVATTIGVITLWNPDNGKVRQRITNTPGTEHSLAFHPAEPLLLCAHLDGKVRTWRLPDGKAGKTLDCHGKQIWCLAVTPDGKLAITASEDTTIKLWSLPDGKEVASMAVPLGETTCAMALDAAGQILATGTRQGRIYLWRIPEGEMVGCLFDPALVTQGTPMGQYRQMGTRTYIQPCDQPLPAGATCLCDCVAANRMCNITTHQVCICDTIAVPTGHTGARSVCSCDTILVGTKARPSCSCVGNVCSCVGNVTHTGSHYWRPN